MLCLRITIAIGSLLSLAQAEYFNDFVDPPHHYHETKKRDPMTRLLDAVEAGDVPPLSEPVGRPLVERLLRELEIPVESQTLVFSKTSLQRRAVDPGNPRAVYFNEEIYLGWMPRGRIEIGSVDPHLGSVFYFQRPLDDHESPLFFESRNCLGCHAGSATNFLPGPLGRSIYPRTDGRSAGGFPHDLAGHEIAPAHRWGGWYVSGAPAGSKHFGNRLVQVREDRSLEVIPFPEPGKSLSTVMVEGDFPYGAKSDWLALLLLDHQIGMHYRLMVAHYKVRQADHDRNTEPGLPYAELPAALQKDYRRFARPVIDYLLFRNEAPLANRGALSNDSDFQRVFLAGKQVDEQGRSLKDLDLSNRLFRYRCSYMIYSDSFTQLPRGLKDVVYQGLQDFLQGGPYPGEECRAIHSILRSTLPDWPFPAYDRETE
ncbi:MAG: hypothetical protein AAF191_03490 [Verrucomicrobiota bacterium]